MFLLRIEERLAIMFAFAEVSETEGPLHYVVLHVLSARR